ncbi:hypothetical protein [Peribacillus frigoritolerans]|uniref:hypothetical protein n=1 Tax=Peribacillus frigoritolerans TaxID=450367 RepID=UPI0032E43294
MKFIHLFVNLPHLLVNSNVTQDLELFPLEIEAIIRENECLLVNLERILVKFIHLFVNLPHLLVNSNVTQDLELFPLEIEAIIREIEYLLVNSCHLLVNLEKILVKFIHLLVNYPHLLVNSNDTQELELFPHKIGANIR